MQPRSPNPHHHPLRTPQPNVHPPSNIQKPHHGRKPPSKRETKKDVRGQYHRKPPSNRRPTLPLRSQTDPRKTSQKNLLHQLLPIGTLEERLPFLPMPPLPPTPTPPRGTPVSPQITWTLWQTQNTHQTRISIPTTTPRLHSLPKRIQKQKTRIPSHITHHVFFLQRKNHQE